MPNDTVSATTTIPAPADAVFAVLADPTSHPAIDGTGWVVRPIDDAELTTAGQVFGMAMYHQNHPDGDYQVVNRVTEFAPPRTIAWETGGRGGRRRTQVRRLALALRPRRRRVRHGRHPVLRLVGGARTHPRVHLVPAVRDRAPDELAVASRGGRFISRVRGTM